MVQSFRLAPMSGLIWSMTIALLALPVLFWAATVIWGAPLAIPAFLVIAAYCWIWLRYRPKHFIVHSDKLEVLWPMKRRTISRQDIASVRCMDKRELHDTTGWCARVGAGGLWGAFGWLWTQKRGIVQMYISRTDEFVWIERTTDRPWLITPEQPDAFVRALSIRAEPARSAG